MSRDQFLTEWMGECWHEWDGVRMIGGPIMTCHKCKGSMAGWEPEDFSTWFGFGKLSEKIALGDAEEYKAQRGLIINLWPLDAGFSDRFAYAWAKLKGWKG